MSSLVLPAPPGIWTPPKPHVWTRPKWLSSIFERFSAYHGQAKCKCCTPAVCTSVANVELDLDLSGSTTCTGCQTTTFSPNGEIKTSFPDPSGIYTCTFGGTAGGRCFFTYFVADGGNATIDKYPSASCTGSPTSFASNQFLVRVFLNFSPVTVYSVQVSYFLNTQPSFNSSVFAVGFPTGGTYSFGSPIASDQSCLSNNARIGGTATVTIA